MISCPVRTQHTHFSARVEDNVGIASFLTLIRGPIALFRMQDAVGRDPSNHTKT